MNELYGEETFLTPKDMVAEADEAKLLDYLQKIGSGSLWIYTESARIVKACANAHKTIVEKNRKILLLERQCNNQMEIIENLQNEAKSKKTKGVKR